MGRESNIEVAIALTLGLLAAVLAFAAEYTKMSITMIHRPTGQYVCQGVISRDEQLAKAASAFMCFNTVWMIIMSCVAFEDSTERVHATAIILSIYSFICSVSGISVLAKGASVSNYQKHTITNCNVLSGYYIAGGILALKACGLGIASYNCLMKSSVNAVPTTKENVEMTCAMAQQPD